jgi:hypothetical protein
MGISSVAVATVTCKVAGCSHPRRRSVNDPPVRRGADPGLFSAVFIVLVVALHAVFLGVARL